RFVQATVSSRTSGNIRLQGNGGGSVTNPKRGSDLSKDRCGSTTATGADQLQVAGPPDALTHALAAACVGDFATVLDGSLAVVWTPTELWTPVTRGELAK